MLEEGLGWNILGSIRHVFRGATKGGHIFWRGILSSIPREWKVLLKEEECTTYSCEPGMIINGNKITCIYEISEHEMKKILVDKSVKRMTEDEFKAVCKYKTLMHSH